jgi:transcriptional regulator with XRE-family HTH domain
VARKQPKPLARVLDGLETKPSDVLARRLAELREKHGWSQRELSVRLAERFGVRVDPATIARIETGDRDVSLNEAFLLAAALDVPPPLLFLPVNRDVEVDVAPGVSYYPWLVWEWLHGEEPLPGADLRAWHVEVQPAWLYSQVRDAQKAAQAADQDVKGAEYVGGAENEARARYAKALRRLAAAVGAMKRAGLPADRLLADGFREDIDRLGISFDPLHASEQLAAEGS